MKRLVVFADSSLAPRPSVAVPSGVGHPLDEADEILLSPAALAELMTAARPAGKPQVVAEMPPA